MKPIFNTVIRYVCPVVKTCRNNHRWPDGEECDHHKPHDFGDCCIPGGCGIEVTSACVPIEEVYK